jgi:hypothetical protein
MKITPVSSQPKETKAKIKINHFFTYFADRRVPNIWKSQINM